MQRLGFDQGLLAEALGVSRQSVNNIITEPLPISRTMAVRLARVTGQLGVPLQDAFRAKGSPATRPSGILMRQQILSAIKNRIIGSFHSTRARPSGLE